MGRLTDEARDLLRLVDRSPDAGEGWRRMSPILLPSARYWASTASELFEVNEVDLLIRLTDEGRTVLKWLA